MALKKADTHQKIDVFTHLAIVKYVTNISNDVWKLDDFLSALLKLCSNTVAPTDVTAHL